MKLKKLFALAGALILSAGAWAQTDVTSQYITNADFSSTDGWTVYQSGSYRDQGNGLIGTYGVRTAEGQAVSTVDEIHLATEYCFGFECRWSSSYASYNQTTEELPVGVYTLTFDVEDTNPNTSKLSYDNLFYVQVGTTQHKDNATEWMNAGKSSWTTHTISFTLEEASTAIISFGYGTGSNNTPSKNTPTIHVSHLKLTYQSLLDGVKALWEEAKTAAEAAVANEEYKNVTGEELTALNAEIEKAEPTTKEGYEEATEALKTATSTFTAAKAAYDAFVTAKTAEYATLTYAATDKRTALNDACSATATSATDATEKTAAITTALRAYYESHAMAEGVEGALNMTDRIANPNAEDGNNGWTWSGSKNNPASNEPWTNADGNNTHKYFDGGNWNANSWTTTMKQTISLPAGKFLLTAKARAAQNVTFTMSVGENSVELPHIGSAGNVFDRGWGDASVEFETDGSDVEISVSASTSTVHEWFSISDFRLVRLELYTEMATAEDYAALTAAIEAAEAKTLGFDEGEYAPYNNVEAIKAIVTAKTIDSSVENEKAEVTALTETLTNGWTANTEEVNAVYDGTLANAPIQATSDNVVLPGWVTKSGNTRQTFKGTGEDGKACLADADDQVGIFVHPGTYNYGETLGYTMPLKAGQKYLAEAKYCAWANGSNNDFTLTILKDGETIATKSYGANATACTVEGALKHVKLYFDVEEAGDYVLSVNANGNTFMTDFYVMKAVAEELAISENADYTPAETYANVTLARTINANKWNTIVLPFALSNDELKAAFGDDVQVAEYSDEGKSADAVTVNFNTMETPAITANKPVLLKTSTAGTSYTFAGRLIAEGEAKVAGTYFDFVGTYDAKVTIDAGNYFIGTSTLDGTSKLYKSAGSTTIKGTRAYLIDKNPETATEVKLNIDGVATSIEAIDTDAEQEQGAIYNLAGQRVSKAVKGIYIINGKKVLK